MIVEIILFVISIVTCFISYLFFLSLRRINQYEDFILKFQQIIEYATEKMKVVDASGHYESDDETDFFFKQLKDIQELLNSLFEIEEEQQSASKNKNKKEK